MTVRNGSAASNRVVRADPSDRASVVHAIETVLMARGWSFRPGSAVPWISPGDRGRAGAAGYSLLAAAEVQAGLEAGARFRRHARG